MKLLFLDIDGVLNDHRTAFLYGNVWIGTPDVKNKLDPYGMAFLKILADRDIKLVLSSSWRGNESAQQLSEMLGLPLYDRTPRLNDPRATRGEEIQAYLDKLAEPCTYVILDDDADMLSHQVPFHVHIDPSLGITVRDMHRIVTLLGWELPELNRILNRV